MMKKKFISVFAAAVFALGLFAGCSSAPTGATQAVAVGTAAPTVTQAAATGAGTTGSAAVAGTTITEEEAQQIALDHAGLTAEEVTFVRVHMDYDNGRTEYEVEFYAGNREYDYDIDAATGAILSVDYDAEYYAGAGTTAQPSASAGTMLSETEAKTIALEQAGVQEDEATFVYVKLDYDDGRTVYEVEFYAGNREYDYELDAYTGEVLSFDAEAEYYTPGSSASAGVSGEYISEEAAKEAALTHAGVVESDTSRLRVEFDYDDGRAEYEVEFNVGWTEYTYEIDASTGEILSYESELD